MWNMALCVTSMFNLNVLLVHLTASLPKLYNETTIRSPSQSWLMDWLWWRSATFIIHAAVTFNDFTNDWHPRQTYNQFKPWEQRVTLLGYMWSSMLFRVKVGCNHVLSASSICEIINFCIFCLSRYMQKWRELAWHVEGTDVGTKAVKELAGLL